MRHRLPLAPVRITLIAYLVYRRDLDEVFPIERIDSEPGPALAYARAESLLGGEMLVVAMQTGDDPQRRLIGWWREGRDQLHGHAVAA